MFLYEMWISILFTLHIHDILACTFADHSILSFLMKILKVENHQGNKEDKFAKPWWEGRVPSLEVNGKILWHPKGLFTLYNKHKGLLLIHLAFMTWEYKIPAAFWEYFTFSF